MAEVPRTTRSGELLLERERRGVRTLTLARGIFVLFMGISHWVVGVSLFEKIAMTVIAGLGLVAIGYFLVLLARRRAIGTVGLVGSLMDVAIIGALPVIWYLSVGGTDVPPAYMLKTQLTVMTLGLVTLNGLALRPLYPLVVAAGGVVVHLAVLVYALSDTRTIVSDDFVDSAMGPALSVVFVLTSILIVAVCGGAMGFLTRAARRTVIQGVQLEVANAHLGRYFSPGVVSRISDDADTVVGADGRTQEVAVMFCDIRDFTSLTEKMPPSDVVRFLSQYHALMVEVIFAFGGTIDKFIGDAIMVTFGTPDPSDDDAERSVRAALAMNNALAGLNTDREGCGLVAIRHGIGIHYGPVIAGNIGSEDRLEYTVIGDTVNVASRIQDACKSVGEGLLISNAVQRQLPPDIEVSPLPEQHVKGRQAPVQIYAVKEKLEALGIASAVV